MAIPAYELIECTMRGSVPQSSGKVRIVTNVFHYRNPGVVGTPNMVTVANNFQNAVPGNVAPLLATQYTGLVVYVRDMSDDRNVPSISASPSPNGSGTAGDRLPLSACVLMVIQTPTRGRGRQGRKFFAPIPEADTLLDDLSAGQLAAWNMIAPNVVGAINDGGVNTWNQILVQRASLVYTAHQLQSYSFSAVTAAITDKNIHNLKKRRDIVQR